MKMICKLLISSILLLQITLQADKKPSGMESLLAHLEGEDIDITTLETTYSCCKLHTLLSDVLTHVRNIEKELRQSRKNIRLAALLPKITVWGKLKNNRKIYLYQKNNISVGKDYVSVGPDDNNTTEGDMDTYQVGARISFDLSDLLYNSDTIRFASEERSLLYYKKELIEKVSYVFYYRAVMNAVQRLNVKVPPEELLFHATALRSLTSWVKELSGKDISSCD